MLIVQLLALKFLFVVFLIDLLENILKSSIIFLQDSVLCAHEQGIVPLESKLKWSVSKVCYRLIRVVHSHEDTWTFEGVHVERFLFWTIFWYKLNLKFSWFLSHVVGRLVLITKCVSSNHNRLVPSWNQSRNILDNNRFSEHGSIKLIPDCTIGRLPHLFQSKLFHSCLVRCYRSTLNAYLTFFYCFSCI